MNKLKQIAYTLLLAITLCTTQTACNKKSDQATSTLISSFYLLSPDSVKAIENARFHINADTIFTYNGTTYCGYIQNRDSMEYGTDLTRVVPIVTSLSIISTILNDSITYTSTDTLDLTSPLKVLIYAQDITISQLYLAKANVHQIDEQLYLWDQRTYPEFSYINAEKALFHHDSLFLFVAESSTTKLQKSSDKAHTWLTDPITVTTLPVQCIEQIIASETTLYATDGTNLYTSTNGNTWQTTSVSTYTIHRLLFHSAGNTYALTTDNQIIATPDDGGTWDKIMDCEDNFPYNDFYIVKEKTPSGKIQYALVGGTTKIGEPGGVWATENGNYWVNLGDNNSKMKSRTKAAAVAYDHKLLIFGGEENGTLAETILLSPDFGLTWATATDKIYPSPYTPTTNATILLDNEYRLYLIGGKDNNGNYTKTIQTGRKNETYFNEYE